MHIKTKQGAIVNRIFRGSSADKSGLQPGDIIVQVNNQKIKDAENLRNILDNMDLQVGDKITFQIMRDNEDKKIIMKLLMLHALQF